MVALSPLQAIRVKYQPQVPPIFNDVAHIILQEEPLSSQASELDQLFPYTHAQPFISFTSGQPTPAKPLKVGIVLSGGQAPGGHNVISGLFDALKRLHSDSQLIGFCDGPNGIVKNKTLKITAELLESYRNQGGFDLIGSGRTKIETVDQFAAAAATVKNLELDGLVIVGGDDSNTNAAFLAEYFKAQGLKLSVIGTPKTIDGDLQNAFIPISFGFDTACKIYAEIIGNILKDALSAKKYYYFIKLMGRSASHIALECALRTQPNFTLIGEEIAQKKQTLDDLVQQLADLVVHRSEKGKDYGVILIPEGIIEFIPEFNQMIQELNRLLATDNMISREKTQSLQQQLSPHSSACFGTLPSSIQEQLLLDRDPHGNVQVSKIETERLLLILVERELKKRKEQGLYKGKFSGQPLFCGYEGRSGLPSNFDCKYCYTLGHVAALLIHFQKTGYIACVQSLNGPVEKWRCLGVPIFDLLHMEEREGKMKAVIRKALVDLQGKPFQTFMQQRDQWMVEDAYLCPGPIQFEGPYTITDQPPLSLL